MSAAVYKFPPGYFCRKAKPATKGHIVTALQRQCLPGDAPLDPEYGIWWLLEHSPSGEVAGFCQLMPRPNLGYGYLGRAGVLPKHRGFHLQQKLIRVRLRECEKLNLNLAYSDTINWNAASMNNLLACGFKPYWPTHPWALKESVYWRKVL